MGGRIVALGAGLAFLGVALGAFGAHGLKEQVTPEMLAVYQTGVQYHQMHALALVLLGLWARGEGAAKRAGLVAGLFTAGIVVFAGSLYALALSGLRILGAITPIGGVCFLAAWAIWAVSAARGSKDATAAP